LKKTNPVKFENVTEEDWRGLLAILIIGCGFALLAVAMALDKPWIASGIFPIIALVTQWYFKAKENPKNGT
jgi:hypothetical protein